MKKLLKDERGLLTIDFIFSAILVSAFTAILFSITVTLSAIEITQYLSYAAARSYFPAHVTEAQQIQQGNIKYSELRQHPAIAPIFNNGWFVLSFRDNPGQELLVDLNDDLYNQPPRSDSENFIGARINLNAKILEFEIPLLGNTNDNEDVFRANVASYLNREPSSDECLGFVNQRMDEIKQLHSSYDNSLVLTESYVKMADNGC